MIFTCPSCGLTCNVRKLPVYCCGRVHHMDSDWLADGELTERPIRTKTPSPAVPFCPHRRGKLHDTDCVACPTGSGRKVRIYRCDQFGECTLAAVTPGVSCCATCPPEHREPRLLHDIRSESLANEPKRTDGKRNAAVGVITARRAEPTLPRTIRSLVAAGWESMHVFDDGDSSGIAEATVRRPAVGPWGNWWLGLEELAQREPDADYYLMCEDDGIVAANARQYVERLPLLLRACILSLYCSARYDFDRLTAFTKGVQFTGAVSLLITRKAADVLLSSGIGLQARRRAGNRGRDHIDGAIGQWCRESGVPLYVHGPSLVQHIGTTSTLGHTEKPPRRFITDASTLRHVERKSNIGLIGWNTASGLGTLNRSAAKHLSIAAWLSPDHPDFARLPAVPGVQMITAPRPVTMDSWRDFLDGLDILLFFETPGVLGLAGQEERYLRPARAAGVAIVCVPMIEWLDDYREWPTLVDQFLCPTRQCYDMMPAELVCRSQYVPWPIDLDDVDYSPRTTCDSFLYCHGTGGHGDRKGGMIVAAAARLAPEIPLTVVSQVASGISSHRGGERPDWPSHVKVLGEQLTVADIYRHGDVCIQPSRMEGLGLQLIECQAAGLPLVTTDGDPMREYRPLRLVAATAHADRVHRAVTRFDASPDHLAEIMRSMLGNDVSAASLAAHDFATHRSWQSVAKTIRDVLDRCTVLDGDAGLRNSRRND